MKKSTKRLDKIQVIIVVTCIALFALKLIFQS